MVHCHIWIKCPALWKTAMWKVCACNQLQCVCVCLPWLTSRSTFIWRVFCSQSIPCHDWNCSPPQFQNCICWFFSVVWLHFLRLPRWTLAPSFPLFSLVVAAPLSVALLPASPLHLTVVLFRRSCSIWVYFATARVGLTWLVSSPHVCLVVWFLCGNVDNSLDNVLVLLQFTLKPPSWKI